MTDAATGVVRLNLSQRLQHGLLLVAVGGALATGIVLGRPLGAGGSAAHAWHIAAGLGSLVLVGYHLVYLAVRGYVEVLRWPDFPLRLGRGDLAAALAEARFVLGSAPARPAAGEYRVSQKVLYWWTLAALALLGATGLGLGFWAQLGTLRSLPALAVAHRGLALALAASLLWHLYGVLVWNGSWSPEWSWVNGVLDADKAQRKVPGAWRRHLRELEEAGTGAGSSPEQLEHSRLTRERDEVQAELEQGNGYAIEERYVEALHHYRRALELYPGYAQARYNMARVLARMGERDMALETYRQFLEADPFHPLAQKARQAVRELEDGGAQP
jgi:cytochrome b subunit of formate dehydrogenase